MLDYGAGATFPAALYTKWFDEYFKLTGVKVNYQSIGSGGGIKSIGDRTVDFGASDAPMADEQLKVAKGEILHVPMALGAVVPTYNIPGLTAQLKFTPDTLSGIFLGNIKTWNDAALVADNPDLKSIDKPIVVVHRSDGSGMTSIWVDYLSTVNKKWETTVGRGTSVNWPVGLGAKGNEGVAGEVKNSPRPRPLWELPSRLPNRDLTAETARTPSVSSVFSGSSASLGWATSRAEFLRNSANSPFPGGLTVQFHRCIIS